MTNIIMHISCCLHLSSLNLIIITINSVILSSIVVAIHGMPPASPVHCNATSCFLSNSYGAWGDRKQCHFPHNNIIYPKTEQDIVLAIATASKRKLKVKVVSKFSHTIPKLACPSTDSSSMVISTQDYNSGIEIDSEKLLVTVDSGVGLRDLIDRVAEAGLSLVASPYWEGVSVGGMISTGAHGSSWWGKGGAVHDHVVGMSLVVPTTKLEGYAKIVRLNGDDDLLLNAAKLSLGLLGVISKVTFSVEEGFKRSIRYNFTDDKRIEDEIIEHGKKHEFGDITWYPSRHTAVYRYDDRVSLSTPGHGVNDFIGFQSNFILISKSDRSAEEALEKARNADGKCALASTFVGYKKLTANGLKNNNILFTNYPVIGHQHKMQASGSCLYSSPSRIDISCAWDPRINGLFFYETTAIFTITNFRSFLLDIKQLRDLNPQNLCGVDMYNGFLIRFIKQSSALLGQSEDSVVVDFNYYRAKDATSPRLNQDLLEEVEQIAFIKYDAKPHWAKNRAVAFLNVKRKYSKFDMFVAAKMKLDGSNMFSNEWSDSVVFGWDGKKFDGCALEGQCICSEDRHCSPQNGYFCKTGLLYKEASVCRYSPSSVA